MKKNKSFLWVIPKWTLPATDGAKVATDRLIKNFVKEGAIIDVLCLGVAGENVDIQKMINYWGVREVYYKKRSLPFNKFIKFIYYVAHFIKGPMIPLTMTSFSTKALKTYYKNEIEINSYDYLFLDGLHLSALFYTKGKFVKPNNVQKVVYRAHNIEHEIWKKLEVMTNNKIKKYFLKIQSNLVLSLEQKVIQDVDLVAPISHEDNLWFKKKFPLIPTHTTVMGMNFSQPLKTNDFKKVQFLFLGRLDWPPNKDGLIWFFENVWRFINYDKFHLHVAGSGDHTWFSRFYTLPGITFHGFVDNIDTLYADTSASIVPIFYGSGTRIKVIEAYTKGRSVISTKMGTKGSGLRANVDYLEAQNQTQWIDALNNFNTEKANLMALSGRTYLQENFDAQKVARSLYQRLL